MVTLPGGPAVGGAVPVAPSASLPAAAADAHSPAGSAAWRTINDPSPLEIQGWRSLNDLAEHLQIRGAGDDDDVPRGRLFAALGVTGEEPWQPIGELSKEQYIVAIVDVAESAFEHGKYLAFGRLARVAAGHELGPVRAAQLQAHVMQLQTNVPRHGAQASAPGPPLPVEPCTPNCEAHKPKSARRAAQRKYWLFQAASDGCLPCVMYMLEMQGVDPMSLSESQSYSALDWSLYGEEEGKSGAAEVTKNLRDHWPQCPSHD